MMTPLQRLLPSLLLALSLLAMRCADALASDCADDCMKSFKRCRSEGHGEFDCLSLYDRCMRHCGKSSDVSGPAVQCAADQPPVAESCGGTFDPCCHQWGAASWGCMGDGECRYDKASDIYRCYNPGQGPGAEERGTQGAGRLPGQTPAQPVTPPKPQPKSPKGA